MLRWSKVLATNNSLAKSQEPIRKKKVEIKVTKYIDLRSIFFILISNREARRLYLRYNAIDSFEEVRKLKDLPKLTSLSLIGNPVCSEPDYRYENFSNMSLNFHTKHH